MTAADCHLRHGNVVELYVLRICVEVWRLCDHSTTIYDEITDSSKRRGDRFMTRTTLESMGPRQSRATTSGVPR
jgi:hypothetical protein